MAAQEDELENLKKQYCQKRKKNLKLGIWQFTFEELYELFKDPGITFTEIAQKAKVARQYVSQIYEQYFAPLFPNIPSGQSRRRVRQKRKIAKKQKLTPEDPITLLVLEQAQKSGLSAEKILTKERRSFYQRLLKIEGKICKIYYRDNAVIPSPASRPLVKIMITMNALANIDFCIFAAELNNEFYFFIVPVEILYKYAQGKEKTTVYLPVIKKKYPTIKPKINWWEYENAWHLLKQ